MAVAADAGRVSLGAAARAAARETAASLAAALSSPNLRRVQYALAGSLIGDWAYAIAVAVYAYSVGGATLVGLWSAIRYVLSALTASLCSVVVDRLPHRRVLIAADLSRFGLVLGAAAAVAADQSAALVFALAALAAMAGTVFRPARSAWMPLLVERPEELTASNAAASTVESLAFFAGPALGAALLTVSDVQTVFLFNAATFLWSAAMIAAVRPRVVPPPSSETSETGDDGAPGALSEIFAGFTYIWHNRDVRLVVGLLCVQTVLAGAENVTTIVLAVHVLGTAAKGVGYINAVFGVGALLGGAVALGRAARNRLAVDFGWGVALWGVPLLLVVAWPSRATVFVGAAAIGFGNPLVDVNYATILQRVAPAHLIGRVFGALEAAAIGAMAVGAALAPALYAAVNLRLALTVIALVAAVPVLLAAPALRALTRKLAAPPGLALLAANEIFAPLPPATVDSLARTLVPVRAPAGEVIVRAGDDSDRFYLIESGLVCVTQGDRFLREQGPGDFFGEIGLLRSVPRTATVTAVADTVLQTVGRAEFLAAVSSHATAAGLAEEVASLRLKY